MSDTISRIKLGGTIYDIIDTSKASIESVEELTSITTSNSLLLNNANSKLDTLLNRISGNNVENSRLNRFV